ncbi:MAG: hypothetical protein ACLQU3_23520 [Limisphaerales bacterium]
MVVAPISRAVNCVRGAGNGAWPRGAAFASLWQCDLCLPFVPNGSISAYWVCPQARDVVAVEGYAYTNADINGINVIEPGTE